MDIVVIGHASIDNIVAKNERRTQLGGASVYFAMASKIFASTGVVSRVGGDFPAEFLGVLKKSSIDINGIKRTAGKSTRFALRYDDRGMARYDRYDLNVGVNIRPEDIPTSYLSAGAFHLAPMAPSKQNSFLEYLREKTYALISLNTHVAYLQRYRSGLMKLLPKVDICTMNDEEAIRLTDTRGFEQALATLKRKEHNLVVVTMGVYGSAIIEDEIIFAPSVIQPRIVDLTGCGDAFAGAFLAAYSKTEDSLQAANIANSVASIAATDWNFEALRNLRFATLESFHEYVISHQRKLSKNQRSLEQFFRLGAGRGV